MRPLRECPEPVLAALEGVFCDIDDTLTSAGSLTGEAYLALEALFQSGVIVVPITGRPAGWCDMIARFWPVSAVVGENGAFAFRLDRGQRKVARLYHQDEVERGEGRSKLTVLRDRIIRDFPGCRVASDQAYREADLAIDYCEDVAPMGPEAADAIARVMREAGATAKVSSIHVNGWFGDYDKLSMTHRLMAEVFAVDLDAREDRFFFVGDSPNDAPMFKFFSNAVGVANVLDFGDRLEHRPAYITNGRAGSGFAELARTILEARGGRLRTREATAEPDDALPQ